MKDYDGVKSGLLFVSSAIRRGNAPYSVHIGIPQKRIGVTTWRTILCIGCRNIIFLFSQTALLSFCTQVSPWIRFTCESNRNSILFMTARVEG